MRSKPGRAGEEGVSLARRARRQTVDCSGLPCEGRFWERKLGPAKAHYRQWLTASEEPQI